VARVVTRKRKLPIAASSALPPLYARWMSELLDGPLPDETEATCKNCAMLESPASDGAEAAVSPPASDGGYFDPVSKCCSYLPVIPNFLVGAILNDAEGPGRTSVEARIDARVAVRPLGLDWTPTFAALYQRVGSKAFGRTRSLRCPHQLDGGLCGIWLHRTAVCATWYCKHVRGGVGAAFWRDGIERLLRAVEADLARHCLQEAGLPTSAILAALPPDGRGERRANIDAQYDGVDEELYASMWSDWRGKERAFFRRCDDVVAGLTWRDVVAIAGPEVKLLARNAKDLHRAVTSPDLPARIKVGRFRVLGASADSVRIEAYSEYDPVEVPAALFPVLHAFDGRTTRQVRATLKKEHGIELEDDFVRMLVDFDILVNAG
jgi:hypothetical protein